MLDIISRSQRARVCEYNSAVSFRTPYIIPSDSEDPISIRICNGRRSLIIDGNEIEVEGRILVPSSYGQTENMMCQHKVCIVRSADDVTIDDDAEIVMIPNCFEFRNDSRRLIATITKIREAAGYGKLIYASGIAEPSTFALLVYMGVDIVDDVLCRAYGMQGIRCIPEGHIWTGNDESEYNLQELSRECEKVADFIGSGRLRELVDQRAPSSPFSVAVLRLMDDLAFSYLEESCPTVGDKFACNTTQSLFRPEVKRFREKILKDYRKPSHKKILVLLPCSARKPYHTSKSHKAFSSAIHTADHDVFVHEVIVTSPLGTVPRELDVFYPANSYDIPVTGEWKCQEKAFIREMVKNIIDQGYDVVISHLGKTTELISDLCEMIETCVGDPTSPVSLTNLENAVRKAAAGLKDRSYMIDRMETMRSILSFQFSPEAADIIMDGSHVIGKFPYWKIINGKTQMGMLTPERQMVSFTIEGCEILAKNNINVVEMLDFELKGNVFAVGVSGADHSIRIGDEAVVTMNGAVKAIGVAQMSGKEMIDLKRGIAVKVRHKSK
jgi:Queuine tRNA-ribosyltransferases, contain PUA domain